MVCVGEGAGILTCAVLNKAKQEIAIDDNSIFFLLGPGFEKFQE